jgi:Uma2 family endonuclease
MPSGSPDVAVHYTVADLHEQLGGVPLERIRMIPLPGTATEADLLAVNDRTDYLCELIDGTLVEKTMGSPESILAAMVITALSNFVKPRKLGIVMAPDALLRVLPDQVRLPDVCFISWNRFPDGKLPSGQVWGIAPDLAVEILSPSNAPGEMQRKLRDYFTAGVRLVWYIDPQTRTARAYTAADQKTDLTASDTLTGGDVLPGFELPLAELFAEIDPPK